MTKKLKRIAPVKFGIILGIVYGLISLIFIPFFLLIAVASAFAPATENNPHPAIGIGVAIVFAVLAPVMYGVMGLLGGMLMAWIYNVAAGWVGGIEVEVE
jgi:hypothetical protein